MLNFGGTNAGGQPNFVPFKTILPYLLGENGLIIGGINLVGNIALLVPIGFLISLICQNITWKKSLALAVVAGVIIEGMQVVLQVGIFDVDDVILNALGVMIGYFAFTILAKWVRSRKYKTIIITAMIIIAAPLVALYAIYPKSDQLVNSGIDASNVQSNRMNNGEAEIFQSGDFCNGTGGTGQVDNVGNSTITIKRKDGVSQIINLTDQTTIKASTGFASKSNLKTGDKVTLVGDPNPDGRFNANTVVVCGVSGSETQVGQ